MPTTTSSFASPYLALDKEKLFYLLACCGALSCHGVGVFSLYPLWHAQFLPQPCLFWVVYHPSRTYLPKELGQKPQNRYFPLSPPPNHTPLPLTHDPTTSHIGWVQAGGAWASRVLSLHVCPKFACRSCICRGLEACLHGLPPFFVLLYGLFYNSLLTLGAEFPLILGFTFLPAHFLIVIMSCHITLSFLL